MMKMHEVVYSDSIGFAERNNGPFLRDCEEIPDPLRLAFLKRFGSDCQLTPVQIEAIKAEISNRSSHFIVSAPTNSGKTLVALFRIFSDLILKRGRCIYVAPLKALAEEKRSEFEQMIEDIASCGGPKIRLSISTGDYQVSGDFLGSPPPKSSELIICTPERLEILLRSEESIFWARTVSTFVIDEFHLLDDVRRGVTVEILVTRILASCPWSRIIALSATMGGLDDVGKWLGVTGIPVAILENAWRYPVLNRKVISTEDKESYTKEMAATVLDDPVRSLIVFISQKKNAEKLAKEIQKTFKSHKAEVSYLHAGLTLKERSERLSHLLVGRKRIIVATTALKMGIDAPVTDVLVHDVFLWGQKGRKLLSYSDLLQMTGRAGRRDLPGNAVVLVDEDQAKRVADLFSKGVVDPLTPQLMKAASGIDKKEYPNPILSVLLSEIVMQKRTTLSKIVKYLNHSFSASVLGSGDYQRQINELVRLKLAYRAEDDPDFIHPTKLGKTVSLTGLSPESGAILAGFLRALIKLDEKYEALKGRRFGYLRRLTTIDFIFLCCTCYECRGSLLKTPSKKAIADVQEFLETLQPEEKPIVNLWRDETSEKFPTKRLLTTLKVPFLVNKEGDAEKVFYRLMRTAILLYQHANGLPLASLAIKFKASIGNLENSLKFSVLWVLSCMSQICNGKRCYKFDFLMMKILNLIECIAIGSEFGELLSVKGIGRNSVNKLIENGLQTLDELSDFSVSELMQIGVKERQSILLYNSIRRKFR